MDVSIVFGLLITGCAVFIGICSYKCRNMDCGNHVRKIPQPTWPRTEIEEVFGV